VWFIVWPNDKKVLAASPNWRGASTPCSRSLCSGAEEFGGLGL
jgi:hypothetical protein